MRLTPSGISINLLTTSLNELLLIFSKNFYKLESKYSTMLKLVTVQKQNSNNPSDRHYNKSLVLSKQNVCFIFFFKLIF